MEFCKLTQLRKREGGRNPLPRLQTPSEVRSLVLLLHHRQTELSEIVAIIRTKWLLVRQEARTKPDRHQNVTPFQKTNKLSPIVDR